MAGRIGFRGGLLSGGGALKRSPVQSLQCREFSMTGGSDLLFGVLALQLELIDRAEFVTAFERWKSDQSKGLGTASSGSCGN